MQSSLLGACVLETDRPDTAGCDQVPICLASGENTWKSLLPRAGRCRSCSVSSCDAGAHPASSAEDGSQMPPCDPNLKRPKRLGDRLCPSVSRAGGLVQTLECPTIGMDRIADTDPASATPVRPIANLPMSCAGRCAGSVPSKMKGHTDGTQSRVRCARPAIAL